MMIELSHLKKVHRPITIKELNRETTRAIYQVPKHTHTVGNVISYRTKKGFKVGVIRKVTQKGVYVQFADKKEGILTEKHLNFIPEEEYEKKAFPYYVLGLI